MPKPLEPTSDEIPDDEDESLGKWIGLGSVFNRAWLRLAARTWFKRN